MVVGLNMLLWIPKAVDVLDVRLLGTPEKTVPTRMVNQGVMATQKTAKLKQVDKEARPSKGREGHEHQKTQGC